MTLLPQRIDFVELWTELARRHSVVGPKIFDLHLVANMMAYSIRNIFSYDSAGFERHYGIQVLDPETV